jgi:hypothetical protein
MLVAKDKIKSNIGEYLLYMFQIEDLLRACNFNKSIIEANLVAQYKTDEPTTKEIRDWYFGLADLMEEEKLETKGHLSFITNKINEVYDFHLYLLQHSDFAEYQLKFNETTLVLNDIKSKHEKTLNDVEIISNTIYGVFLLKLKKQEISAETIKSASILSKFMAELSNNFKKYELGELKLE